MSWLPADRGPSGRRCRCGRRRPGRAAPLFFLALGALLPGMAGRVMAVAGDGDAWRSPAHAQAVAEWPEDEPRDIGRLRPKLSAAFEDARAAAAADGVELVITSGYRSPAYQQQLFSDAIAQHGSAEAARKWVLPPDESSHVSGLAIDVGPEEAGQWLAAHGARWSLCQAYAWEWWHYEYRPEWVVDGHCPAPQTE